MVSGVSADTSGSSSSWLVTSNESWPATIGTLDEK